jgi:hypothetical protein
LKEQVVRLDPGDTKNKDGRLIPLGGELLEMLRMQKTMRDEMWPACSLVFSRGGKQILYFRGSWKKACEASSLVDDRGEPTRLFHDLRRTGVRNLVRAGVPERVAMAISGHKTRSIFDRYNIVSERDLHDAARKLNDYISEAEKTRDGDSLVTGASNSLSFAPLRS